MHSDLRKVFEKLEREREYILERVGGLTPAQYDRSRNGKWSISQILTHLLTSERLALRYMQKKSLGVGTLKNSDWRQPLMLFLLKISQRLPLRYKVPKAILEHTPSVALSFEDLRVQWAENRQQLKEFLESIDDDDVRKKIFKHPIAGRFNAVQGIVFLREHLLHHLPQIERLL